MNPALSVSRSVPRPLLAALVLVLGGAWGVAAQSPESPHGDLSISCSECHSTEGWTPLIEPLLFDHGATGFALEDGHSTVRCESCHLELVFAHVGSACADCHLDPHLGELGFSCESCHETASWDPRATVRDMHDATLFPLTGAHRVVDCAACHTENPPFEFQLTPTDCFACHADDYLNADLDHVELGFPTTCENCHSTLAFQPATLDGSFDHDAFFPLRGAHEGLDCAACHAGGFGGTPTECYACHQDDYLSTTDPNHQALGFPLDCENCHSTTMWEGATAVEHDTFFPLNGAHAVLDCQECHAEGFEGTPTDCYACHQDDYDGTTDPNHAASGFPTSCEDCHGESSWEDAVLDHSFFPLTGAHAPLDCESCHAEGFPGTPTECVGCHLDDYNQTTDPDHEAAGFPTSCEDCHNTSDWEDADFNHDQLYFPIYSGRHEGEWQSCEDCHVVPSDFGVFECIFCHAHEQEDMDDEHDDVPGYEYESMACLSCHPDGEE